MTLSEDFISLEQNQEVQERSYPTAFGVKFTPTISGILIAVLGAGAAVYLLSSLLIPTWQKYQELQATRNQKQDLVNQKQTLIRQADKVKAELAKAKQENAEVLALFANEKTLDTLLLDLNRQVEASNAQATPSSRAKLEKFVPANQIAEVISDSSFGTEVNGKLKRRIVNMTFTGTFEQTQSIIRNIERLQPLLIFREYESSLDNIAANQFGNVAVGPDIINTSFQIQALIPATPEEIAAAAQPPADPQKK